MRLKERIAQTPPPESDLSPERQEKFEQLLKKVLSVHHNFESNNSFKDFKKEFNSYWNHEDILNSRRVWLECKKAGVNFEKFLQQKLRSALDVTSPNTDSSVYQLIKIYAGLGSKKSVSFLGNILTHPSILKNPDLSSFGNIVNYIASAQDPRSIKAIKDTFKELENAFQEGSMPRDETYYYPSLVRGLLSVYPGSSEDALDEIREESNTFKSWFELQKSIIPFLHKKHEKKEFEPFDEKFEEERLKELEEEVLELQKNPKQHIEWDDYYTPSDDDPFDLYPQNPLEEDTPIESTLIEEPEEESKPETPQLINFYRRFRPDASRSPLTPQEQFTAIVSLAQTKEKNADDILQMLAGYHPKQPVQLETNKMEHPDVLRSIVTLTIARVLSVAVLESRFEGAIDELKETQQYFKRAYEQEKKESKDNYSEKLSLLTELQRRLAGYELRIRDIEKQLSLIALPKSADAFLLYHPRFDRVKEIPDFRTLLGEKIRYLLAKQLTNETLHNSSIFSMIEEIIKNFASGLELYTDVENNEVPMYWESADTIDERGSDHLVVFGRDGRYFFTALKAQQFGGQEQKKLVYIIVGRSLLHSETMVANYLKQHGVSLDFTFIDTGYAGSIPEAAIRYLAKMEGVEISSEEINKKISLLSSSNRSGGRRELSRKKIGDQSRSIIIQRIEHRAKAFYKPTSLTLEKNGRLVPQKNPKEPNEQLRAWIVEHVSLRNFAPRQNPDKTISYLRSNPLKGYRFVADLRATGIGTHPIELWEQEKGSEKILMKGGPDHTIRADFVGQRFLQLFFLAFNTDFQRNLNAVIIPDTDIILQNNSPKLKVDFLDGWHDGGIQLPSWHKDSMDIQAALLVDALIGNYDRTPWNFLFKDNNIAFIDNGASLTSRARGGHKGFHPSFSIEDLKTILENPQFPGTPVNEAYDNFVKVIEGNITIDDPILLRRMLDVFLRNMTDIHIDDIVDQAGFLNGKKSIVELQKRIVKLEQNIHHLVKGSREYTMTTEAIETYKSAIESGGEAPYMKMALKKRRDDIIALFTKALETQS